MNTIKKQKNKKVFIKVMERTRTGVRFLDLKGIILKTEEQYIHINGYAIKYENIIKWQEIQ